MRQLKRVNEGAIKLVSIDDLRNIKDALVLAEHINESKACDRFSNQIDRLVERFKEDGWVDISTVKPLLTRVLNLVETMKEDLDDSLSWIEKVTDKFELD